MWPDLGTRAATYARPMPCQGFCQQSVVSVSPFCQDSDTVRTGDVSLGAGTMGTGESPVQQAAAEFVAEFARWRLERGLSKKQLAADMGFDPSYLSHVEAHRHRPTEDFAKRAEAVLQAGGAIWRRYREYDEVRATSRAGGRAPGPREPASAGGMVGHAGGSRDANGDAWLPGSTGLVVEREISRLSYVDGRYRCTVRRSLYNAGNEPVTRYLIRIVVDRYPNDSERSNRHHRDNPLTWDELHLIASSGGERMEWRPKTDRDAYKEAWLLFENDRGRFPLYPGQRAMIQYTYHVGADKWGPWFQRAVRLPTRRLSIELDLPMALRPVVWGVETTLSAESVPLRTPIEQEIEGDRGVFAWSCDNPPLHARYRLEWRFRAQPVPAQRTAVAAGNGRDQRPGRRGEPAPAAQRTDGGGRHHPARCQRAARAGALVRPAAGGGTGRGDDRAAEPGADPGDRAAPVPQGHRPGRAATRPVAVGRRGAPGRRARADRAAQPARGGGVPGHRRAVRGLPVLLRRARAGRPAAARDGRERADRRRADPGDLRAGGRPAGGARGRPPRTASCTRTGCRPVRRWCR